MGQIMNWSVTGASTIFAALAAFVLQTYATDVTKLEIFHAYLFLVPAPLLVYSFAMLASHRNDIYRKGYYLAAFFDEPMRGAEWTVRSLRFRELMPGESQDPAAWIFMALFAISSGLFVSVLVLIGCQMFPHLLCLAIFFVAMLHQFFRFTKDKSPMYSTWLQVKKDCAEQKK